MCLYISLQMGEPLVLASIRVLGAWLAEESLALSKDVYALLPFLLKLTSQHAAVEVGGWVWCSLQYVCHGVCGSVADVGHVVVVMSSVSVSSFSSTVSAVLAGKGHVAISFTRSVPPHRRGHPQRGATQRKAPHSPAEPLPGGHQGVH